MNKEKIEYRCWRCDSFVRENPIYHCNCTMEGDVENVPYWEALTKKGGVLVTDDIKS